MKIDIHISDASPSQLIAISKALGGRIRNLGKTSPEAPYGRKKDGTPRKRPGRPPVKWEL